MEVLEDVSNNIKYKFKSKLIIKYLKAEKMNTKEGFQCLYSPTILIDSICRKDENYFSKVFLERNNFIEDIENFRYNSDEEYYPE